MTENTTVTTKRKITANPSRLAMAAAFAISSTVPTNFVSNEFQRSCSGRQSFPSATAAFSLDKFGSETASTETRPLNHKQAAQALEQLLIKEGLRPSRIDRTGDQSVLFQFLGKNRACVDLYPSGELIVLLRNGNQDEIHELEYADTDRMIKLLKNAGTTS